MNEITFTSGSDCCSAWHLQATSEAFGFYTPGRPCFVMAPPSPGTRDSSCWGVCRGPLAQDGRASCSSTTAAWPVRRVTPAPVSVGRQALDSSLLRLLRHGGYPASTPTGSCCGAPVTPTGHVVVVAAQDLYVAG